jgi:antirestriction protein ArdC
MKAFEKITNIVIENLEKDIIPWQTPWENLPGERYPINISTGSHYSGGCNIFMLNFYKAISGFPRNYWLTFNQAKKLGGTVKKGSSSCPIIYADTMKRKILDEDNKQKRDEEGNLLFEFVPFLKTFNVFNVAQVEGIDHLLPNVQIHKFKDIEAAEKIVVDYFRRLDAPKLTHTNLTEAYYSPVDDLVNTPPKSSYKQNEMYYSVIFHEMGHSTGSANRLDRNLKSYTESKELYSSEELVAEFSSLFLCNESGIVKETIDNSSDYIKSWLSVLNNDKSIIFKAAKFAQEAFEFITNVAVTKVNNVEEAA